MTPRWSFGFRFECMVKLITTFIFLMVLSPRILGQNISQLARVDYQDLHQANLNDVWGYVDETGKEYAIVGTSKGTSVLDISNPSAPVEVFWVAGSQSIWRDPCVYGDYAYITTEAEDGMTIIDLSPLPGSTELQSYIYTGTTPSLLSAHTCFVDENGYAYLFGSNIGNGGVRILDVQTNPTAPVEVGSFDTWYVHDGFVRNDTMFLAHINDGFVSLVDVTDKTTPQLLGTQTTPNNFSHNAWPSADGQVVYTTDEVSGAYVTSYDISDPQNMVELDRFANSPGSGVPPHNTHVLGDYLITSYYSDGVVINDITYPDNIIRVGQFDTYPGQTAGFDGCWGVYPFFPSGNIVASDITEGLFVLGVNYQKASYLEGLITDAVTGLPIASADIQISTDQHIESSRIDGTYKTGVLGTGTFEVLYSKVGYYPLTVSVTLSQGSIAVSNVQMVPIPPYQLTVNVLEEGTLLPILDAQILLQAYLIEHNGLTNGLGQETLTLYYQEIYGVTVAKWGYFPSCFEQFIDNTTNTLNIYLQKGYHDEFSFDLGWQISGTATSGHWERGVPNPTPGGAAPGSDGDYDCSDKAYVTGNDPTFNPDVDDVDGGITVLTSPTMDLSGYTNPHLNFYYWFFCMHGNPPDDTMNVVVNNGAVAVTVASIPPDEAIFYQWNAKSIRLLDYLPSSTSMTVSFRISDYDPNVNITEAGVDYFYISNANVTGLSEEMNISEVYPVPATDKILLKGITSGNYTIRDLRGTCVAFGIISSDQSEIQISHLASGSYLLELEDQVWRFIKE